MKTDNDSQRPDAGEAARLRRLLWLRHGCEWTALYGDDGEMQCNRCAIDFKTLSPDEIEARWVAINTAALAPTTTEEADHEDTN